MSELQSRPTSASSGQLSPEGQTVVEQKEPPFQSPFINEPPQGTLCSLRSILKSQATATEILTSVSLAESEEGHSWRVAVFSRAFSHHIRNSGEGPIV